MDDQRHVALPKLYGAPAYARPPVVPANPVPRPIDPDDLPLIAEMTADDRPLIAEIAEMTADDLPLIAEMAPAELDGLQELGVGIAGTEPPGVVAAPAGLEAEPAPPDAVGDAASPAAPPPAEIQPRPFSIRDVVQRIRSARP